MGDIIGGKGPLSLSGLTVVDISQHSPLLERILCLVTQNHCLLEEPSLFHSDQWGNERYMLQLMMHAVQCFSHTINTRKSTLEIRENEALDSE